MMETLGFLDKTAPLQCVDTVQLSSNLKTVKNGEEMFEDVIFWIVG